MFYQFHSDHITLSIKVSANSPKNEIKMATEADERLHIKIRAVREKGRANDELIAYLSGIFNVPKKNIALLRGETTPLKVLAVYGLSKESLLATLSNLWR